MRCKRAITVTLDSALSDDEFTDFLSEVTDAVEQIACDYAAACHDDQYEVHLATPDRCHSFDVCNNPAVENGLCKSHLDRARSVWRESQ
jgi:hypothetical protein